MFFYFFEFRSLNLEQEAQTKQLEKDKERATLTGITTPTVPSEPSIYSCKYSRVIRLDSLTSSSFTQMFRRWILCKRYACRSALPFPFSSCSSSLTQCSSSSPSVRPVSCFLLFGIDNVNQWWAGRQ